MKSVIEKEFTEFKKYHKNINNIYFHIFCGFIYMTLLFLLFKEYSYILLFIYFLLILFTLSGCFEQKDKYVFPYTDPGKTIITQLPEVAWIDEDYSENNLKTTKNIIISFIILIVLFVMIYCFKKYRIIDSLKFSTNTNTKLIILFLIFYFLPELSHKLTKEPAMLNINNITPLSIFVNIFYLLPFSLMCLPYFK